MFSHNFDTLFAKTRPHILEMICLSLDYDSFKNCLEVNKAWKGALTTKMFQKTAKHVFCKDILKDEKKLMRDSEKGKTEKVRRLLSIGLLNVDCTGNSGETPLHMAARMGHKYVTQHLLDGGADPNKVDKYGRTPLYMTVRNGNKDVVQLLLDGGADPNRGRLYGRTPLHEAAMRGLESVVLLLLDVGGDPSKLEENGRTPLQLAAKYGHNGVFQLLEKVVFWGHKY